MEKLVQEVRECIEHEYGRASVKFGPVNNSDHESYAIILEEYEEASAEADNVSDTLTALWNYVKANGSGANKIYLCKHLENQALLAACEFIQVAAMAHKAAITISSNTTEGASV